MVRHRARPVPVDNGDGVREHLRNDESETSSPAIVYYLCVVLICAALATDCYNFHSAFPSLSYGFRFAFFGPFFVMMISYTKRFAFLFLYL